MIRSFAVLLMRHLLLSSSAELDRMAYTRELPIRRAVSVREGARESGGCILHAAKGCFRRFRCVLRASKCRRASLGAEREKA